MPNTSQGSVREGKALAIYRLPLRNALYDRWHRLILASAPIDDGRVRGGPCLDPSRVRLRDDDEQRLQYQRDDDERVAAESGPGGPRRGGLVGNAGQFGGGDHAAADQGRPHTRACRDFAQTRGGAAAIADDAGSRPRKHGRI